MARRLSWQRPSTRTCSSCAITSIHVRPTTRHELTLAVEGGSRIRRLQLRNGVLVTTNADKAAPMHHELTRRELAAFVLGILPQSETDPLSHLDRVLDRSHLLPPGTMESVMKEIKACNEP